MQQNHPILQQVKLWLDSYFRGENPGFEMPLSLEGTEFQKQVWNMLLNIPYGKTRTYGDIAREMAVLLGKEKMSAQAVGQAVGRNPIGILIPCHRVIGADGSLGGYSAGLDRKRFLLDLEGIPYREPKKKGSA